MGSVTAARVAVLRNTWCRRRSERSGSRCAFPFVKYTVPLPIGDGSEDAYSLPTRREGRQETDWRGRQEGSHAEFSWEHEP
jgi:hypothetical protein